MIHKFYKGCAAERLTESEWKDYISYLSQKMNSDKDINPESIKRKYKDISSSDLKDPLDLSCLEDHQYVLEKILSTCKEKHYCRDTSDNVLDPVFIDNHFTLSYKKTMDICGLVNKLISRDNDRDLYLKATRRANTVSWVKEYLKTSCITKDFPILEKNRGIFAFRNGVYFTSVKSDAEPNQLQEDGCCPYRAPDLFISYEDVNFKLDDTRMAVKYIDKDMPWNEIKNLTWDRIRTPKYENLLDNQRFSPEVKKYHYGFRGRLLYQVKEKDNWQVWVMDHGGANSGRSAASELFMKLYEKDDIVHLQDLASVGTSHTKKEKFEGKLVMIGEDIEETFYLEPDIWEKMVLGEDVPLPSKTVFFFNL